MSTLICTHFNWDWIVCIAANEISQSDYITPVSTDKNILNTVQPSNITKVSFRQLYSVQRQKCLHPEVKIKPSYALFRLEITEAIELPEKLSSEPDIRGVWADSDAFSFLDAKDSLFRHLKTVGYENAMPPTIMIPWDVTDRNELNRICDDYKQQMKIPINEDSQGISLPFKGSLLKAALGAGGFGLYFVETMEDALSVIKAHAARAAKFEGFMEQLIVTHGKVPDWSLQRLISPVRSTVKGCKTQIRAYVVKRGKNIYLYNRFEVRLPSWNDDASETTDNNVSTTIGSVESELIGEGNARPYNQGRSKSDTDRVLLEEISELNGSEKSIFAVVRSAMSALYPFIENQTSASVDITRNEAAFQNISHLAIAALDLLVEYSDNIDQIDGYDEYCIDGFRAYIVELNSNPAMPGQSKRMSEKYYHHIKDFVKNLIILGLSDKDNTVNESFIALI